MSQTLDRKIQVIYDNYHDSFFAANTQKDVESLRRQANKYGAAITTLAFVGNEFVRVTARSRKYLNLPLTCLSMQPYSKSTCTIVSSG